ncbi:gluconeogenesis factor YvcK family protein [Acetilactobacillus jinshanensis]|nr:gluconeogenesis factor YvcK family protein [Acetilactobacillus jinshanensis]
MDKKPNVVVIGGGTGIPSILKDLKDEPINLTAVVTVADDGGSTGILRKLLGMVPMGDLRNCLSAMSTLPKADLDLFEYRFKNNDKFLAHHTIGNLLLAAALEKDGNINNAVQDLCKIMKVNGHIYPACNQALNISAKFTDGTMIQGESEITAAHKSIAKLWTSDARGNEPKALPQAIHAIMNADQIVLGPGSLYTSVMPNLVIPDLGEAVVKSGAQVVYVCNALTQKGETSGYTDADHVKALNKNVGHQFVNYALVNDKKIPANSVDFKKYTEYSYQVKTDPEAMKQQHCQPIYKPFLVMTDGDAVCSGKMIANELMKLVNNK